MRIEAVGGDITRQTVDAVVNAANSTLLGGGGVDGAIHAAAGPRLLEECRRLRSTSLPQGLPVGEAVATGAGDLPARWVIHTVGPNRHRGQTDPELLASCFRRSLDVAAGLPARSVAFPAVSAGVYGWPVEEVARIAAATVRSWSPPGKDRTTDADAGTTDADAGTTDADAPAVELVRFVLFGPAALAAFERALSTRT
jgi:O-acetyl-ADP-ribose deacetylase (regulator of RNase III)